MGSDAWANDGTDVPTKYNIPWAAVRKGSFIRNNILRTISKLTLNGLTYDFKKQAKEGLVVIGNNYESLTFFLPEDREPMTAEDGENMTIVDYFTMLSTTEYANIIAWDRFAKFVSNASGILQYPDELFPYELRSAIDSDYVVTGVGSFHGMTTFIDLATVFYTTIDRASSDPQLSHYMDEDGTIKAIFKITTNSETGDYLEYPINIGRK